jgi:hypothetical protein
MKRDKNKREGENGEEEETREKNIFFLLSLFGGGRKLCNVYRINLKNYITDALVSTQSS